MTRTCCGTDRIPSEENNHPEIVRKTVGQILDKPETVNARHFEIDILKRKSPNGVFEL